MDTSGAAAVAETHVSVVFFAGDRAYKLLKPVRTDFLDHSTRERREVACRREVELNRRLAPDVYLGVSDLVEDDRPADHLIVMRRLPASRRLSALIGTEEFPDAVRDVARRVAAFHAAQPPSLRAARNATAAALGALWDENLDAMARFATGAEDSPVLFEPIVLERVRRLAHRYLDARRHVFDDRIAAGLARDGHGDLLAEDIFCLPDGPRILDCLAFDDDLRCTDVLLDVAFLVMDLERLAGPTWGRRFLEWYQEFGNEHHPASLAEFYVAYRALVRSKVSGLRAEQGSAAAAEDARSFLVRCEAHLRAAEPVLVLVGGAPGTGKSTVADGVSRALGWPVLSSDELRKDLTGVGHEQHAFAEPGAGIYRADVTTEVYAGLVRRAGELVEAGESVVVDASFVLERHRADLRRRAAALGARVVELCCVLGAEEADARITYRLARERTTSDATPDIAGFLRAGADPWPQAVEISTQASRSDALAAALSAVAGPAGDAASANDSRPGGVGS